MAEDLSDLGVVIDNGVNPVNHADLGLIVAPEEHSDLGVVFSESPKPASFSGHLQQQAENELTEPTLSGTIPDQLHHIDYQSVPEQHDSNWTKAHALLSQATQAPLHYGLAALSIPRRALWGNVVRGVAPDLYQDFLKGQTLEAQDPNQTHLTEPVANVVNKLAPDLFLSQLTKNDMTKAIDGIGAGIEQAFTRDATFQRGRAEAAAKNVGSTADPDMAGFSEMGAITGKMIQAFSSPAASTLGFAQDTITDPLVWASVFGKTAQAIGLAADSVQANRALLEEMASGKLDIGEFLAKWNTPAKTTTLAQDVQQGNRAFLTAKIPFRDKPVTLIRGDKIIDAYQKNIANSAAGKLFSSLSTMFSPETSFGDVNLLNSEHAMGKVGSQMWANKTRDMIGDVDPDIMAHANNISEFGEESANKLSQKMGIKLSDEQKLEASQLVTSLRAIEKKGVDYLVANGMPPPEYSVPTVADKAEKAQALAALFPNGIPPELADHLWREQRLLPRSLGAEALSRRAVIENTPSGKLGKLSVVPQSFKDSEVFSSPVMEAIQGKKTGMTQSFDNVVDATIKRTQGMFDSVGNRKFIDGMMKFGGTREEMMKRISNAKQLVQQAIDQGIPIANLPAETMQMSLLNPNKLVPVDNYAFQQVSRAMGTAKDGTPLLNTMRENLLFPPDVAQTISTRFGPGTLDVSVPEAAINWVNNQWRKGILTNPFRAYRDTVSNTVAYTAARGNLNRLMEAATQLTNGKHDAFTQAFMASPYSEALKDAPDFFKGKINVSLQEANSPAGSALPFWQMVHDAAGSGQSEAMMKLIKGLDEQAPSIGEKLRNGVDKVMDNRFFEKIRNMGAASYNVYKLGLARTLFLDGGYSMADAMRVADKTMISFANVSPELRAMRSVLPFASFQMRNLARLPILLAQNPGIANFSTYFQQGMTNWGGWKPSNIIALKKITGNTFNPDPIITPLMQGSKELGDNQDFLKQIMPDLVGAFGGDTAKKQIQNGMVYTMRLPTPYEAAQSFFDPDRFIESIAPASKALMSLLGKDVTTGKDIPFSGTLLQDRERYKAALSNINPAQVPNLISVGKKLISRLVDNFAEQNTPPQEHYDVTEKDKKSAIQQRIDDREWMKAIVSFSSGGLGYIASPDLVTSLHNLAVAREWRQVQDDFHKEVLRTGDKSDKPIIRQVGREYKKIAQYNRLLNQTYKQSIMSSKGAGNPESDAIFNYTNEVLNGPTQEQPKDAEDLFNENQQNSSIEDAILNGDREPQSVEPAARFSVDPSVPSNKVSQGVEDYSHQDALKQGMSEDEWKWIKDMGKVLINQPKNNQTNPNKPIEPSRGLRMDIAQNGGNRGPAGMRLEDGGATGLAGGGMGSAMGGSLAATALAAMSVAGRTQNASEAELDKQIAAGTNIRVPTKEESAANVPSDKAVGISNFPIDVRNKLIGFLKREKGETMLHGTNAVFDEFKEGVKGRRGANSADKFYFTDNPAVAQRFAESSGKAQDASYTAYREHASRVGWDDEFDSYLDFLDERLKPTDKIFVQDYDGKSVKVKKEQLFEDKDIRNLLGEEGSLMVYPRGREPKVVKAKLTGKVLDLTDPENIPSDLMASLKKEGRFNPSERTLPNWDHEYSKALINYAKDKGFGRIKVLDGYESGFKSTIALPDFIKIINPKIGIHR